jgi:DNA-binding response OmpR family regulator
MMPGLDGYRVLKTLREEGYTTPVLILSARGEETDKVRGFRLGADDYVTKPFSLLELLARVEALLRRSSSTGAKAEQEGLVYRFGDVAVDTVRQQVTRADEAVQLTHREYMLLLALLQRKGAVVSRIDLLKEVWGYRGAVNSRTVDTHIMELRRKLEQDPSQPRHILTIRKSGYRLQS